MGVDVDGKERVREMKRGGLGMDGMNRLWIGV